MRNQVEFVNPLNTKKFFFNYYRGFQAIDIMDKSKIYMRYGNPEFVVKDVFHYLEFGDVDWSFLTKFYEMEN